MNLTSIDSVSQTRQAPQPTPRPLRYVQVVQHLQPGGIETLALDLGATTTDAAILSLEGSAEHALSRWPRLGHEAQHLYWFGKASGLRPSLLFSLMRFFKTHAVQCVHTHHIGPLLYAGIAARLAGVPVLIHTEHDAWHLQARKRRWLQRIILRITRPQLVADAQPVAENMRYFLGARPITVIPNGIDCERFKPGCSQQARARLELPQQVTLIGASGRLEPVKGQRFLIEALAQMDKQTHLALAGSGSQAHALRQLADQLGVQTRVHFLGHLDDMPTFYQALDLFCLPSLNEGFPLSPLEAQACSVRAAVTDVGAAKHTLCPKTGVLLPVADPQTMAKRLQQALTCTHTTTPRDFVTRTADLHQTRAAYRQLMKRRGEPC